MATRRIPPTILHTVEAPVAADVIQSEGKKQFAAQDFNYFIMAPKNGGNPEDEAIVCFSGHYFVKTHVHKYFYQTLCHETKQKVIVFEYPTIAQGCLDEIMDFIDKLLREILKQEKIKSVYIAGDNSGCFYAYIYTDFVLNLLNKESKKMDIKGCMFIDGIYSISTLPNGFYKWLFSSAILEFSSKRQSDEVINNDVIQRYRFLAESSKRIIRVKMNVMSSMNEFHLKINREFVQQDTWHRKLTEVKNATTPFFYLHQDQYPVVMNWFKNCIANK